jgi:hypothetical protein
VLAFASIVPGEIAADFMPFRGYYTRLFAALVGAAGRTYAVVPEDLTHIERIAKGRAEIAAFAASEPTIELASGPVAQAGALPEPVDLFWISENYHDLHNAFMGPVDIGAFNAAVFGALKPGGRLIITDHVAAKGAPGMSRRPCTASSPPARGAKSRRLDSNGTVRATRLRTRPTAMRAAFSRAESATIPTDSSIAFASRREPENRGAGWSL